jgi:Predicted membrane protein
MVLIFFTTFGTVFVAEIVGDKLLYTTGVLATRFRTLPIMLGMAAAFMAKMGVAVMVGEAISRLPPVLVASITAISFLSVAFALWRKSDQPKKTGRTHSEKSGDGLVRGHFSFRMGRCWTSNHRNIGRSL